MNASEQKRRHHGTLMLACHEAHTSTIKNASSISTFSTPVLQTTNTIYNYLKASLASLYLLTETPPPQGAQMVTPVTPQRTGDAIEEIKQSLSVKWGLRFPARNSVSSPSSRNHSAIEEKVHNYIRFLYYAKSPAEGALDFGVAQFEKEAPRIISEWQFKAQAEPGVIPSRKAGESALRRDFLKRRPDLNEKPIKAIDGTLRMRSGRSRRGRKEGSGFPTTRAN